MLCGTQGRGLVGNIGGTGTVGQDDLGLLEVFSDLNDSD